MPKLRVLCYSISLDGFGAGTDQRLDQPLGFRGPEMFQWFFPTRTWRAMQGQEGGETGVDDAMAAKGQPRTAFHFVTDGIESALAQAGQAGHRRGDAHK